MSFSPIALTQNERYDRLTKKVIQKVCSNNSVCIDIGAHEGKILSMMVAQSPFVKHYAFEPIPALFQLLEERFSNNVLISQLAISDKKGITSFNLVNSNYALSGIKKRRYSKQEIDSNLVVHTDCLDHVIPYTEKVALIKLDIEGGELLAIKGALKTIAFSQPILVFECGKIGGEAYDFSAKDAYQLFDKVLNYQLFLLQDWLLDNAPLSFQKFQHYFEEGTEFFFLAAPKATKADRLSN